MKKLLLTLASEALLTICWIALAPPGLAQTSSTQTPPLASTASAPAPTEKKKKVWTEEDLRKIHGGVNVVGEADKPPARKVTAKKDGTADTAKVEEVVPEEPPQRPTCMSWSWAAAVDAALGAQGVNFGREYWIMKSYGGQICTPDLGNVAELTRRLEGDYVLEDGTKVRIKGTAFSRTTREWDLVASFGKNLPYVVVWKGHPYVTTHFTGTRWEGSSGTAYTFETIDMADPYEEREVQFSSKTSNIHEIEIWVHLVVTKP